VAINFDVLGSFMIKLIGSYLEGRFVVTVLQAGREEDVNPEGGKTTIVTHMWWWQGLYTRLQRSCGR